VGFHLGVLLLSPVASACDDDDDAAADGGHHEAGSDGHGDHEHGHNSEEMVGPLTGATCPSGSTLTYDNFAKGFMTKYCLRCHSSTVSGAERNKAPDDHNFDALADLELVAGHINQRAGSGPSATNEEMPPSDPKPSTEEREQLSEWIACGLKE
jgi:hypothetical protein